MKTVQQEQANTQILTFRWKLYTLILDTKKPRFTEQIRQISLRRGRILLKNKGIKRRERVMEKEWSALAWLNGYFMGCGGIDA